MNAPDRRAAPAVDPADERRQNSSRSNWGPSLRITLTLLLIGVAVVPAAAFGSIVLLAGLASHAGVVVPLLIGAMVGAAFLGLLAAGFALSTLTGPLRRITSAVERVAAGEPGPPINLTGDDELARLADSHNRIAAEVLRRNRELATLLTAVAAYSPGQGVAALAAEGEQDACHIYGLIDCRIALVDPATVPLEERIPGDPRPVRAAIKAGGESMGVLTGHLPATRGWERADQDLLDLFASEVGVALRNADLFGQIERQNARLVELDSAKDEFLRGVSHNLQTPLTSIRAYIDQLRSASKEAAGDRRLQIVAEQADRLTRLVRQLLTVTRLEAGVLSSQVEVLSVAPRVRRAWEALNATDVEFELRDETNGWLGVADPDQLDQVLWALLDNAIKYGGPRGRVQVEVRADETIDRLHVTIADHGPGISEADRRNLFTRFTRGSGQGGDGTGLGLYVSRQLLRGMSGELWIEKPRQGIGAEFIISLPGEPPGDGA
jgi:signal transduction histidine kinase/HAMP domain-containing protein